MSDPIKRAETTHIDEVTRTSTTTLQWFLENRNMGKNPTHPITHNNKLTMFICGEEGFRDIAEQIKLAKATIDLCCWGFDPGMELVRGAGGTWPRGETFGDLLIAAGKRGVKVRLLVWYDYVGSKGAHNMPGFSGDYFPIFRSTDWGEARAISAQHSLALAERNKPYRNPRVPAHPATLSMAARSQYCESWYTAAFANLLDEVTVRTRGGSPKHIRECLATEKNQPSTLSIGEFERAGMERIGTHHQKPVLIDFAHDEGAKAVGYVMGLNSVTDYWDTADHMLENPRREYGGKMAANECLGSDVPTPGYETMKPYRDYACRIDGGRALIALHHNFVTAWDRASADTMFRASDAVRTVPTALLRPAKPGDSTVQIIRTQSEEHDKTIKEAYFQATDIATLAQGYLYVENQYFQYEEWAQRLMQTREKVIAAWKLGCAKAGKNMEDLPIMHVFLVIPVPERAQMIPRTHDTLATLGQSAGMTGQNEMIKDANEPPKIPGIVDDFGQQRYYQPNLPDSIEHANSIKQPDINVLKNRFGLKISTAMLNVCDFDTQRWRYREIYIHSKLMLIDDVFMTIGSANINQRSMAVDSELNLSTTDHELVSKLRRRIWEQLTGGVIDGGDGSWAAIGDAFEKWETLMDSNQIKMLAKANETTRKKMTGFLLPLEDKRSSTMRLG